jgi:predicted nucleotidyltransferase
MADSAVLSPGEQAFLRGLNQRSVRYMLVGMSAALMQGARGATEDIDLWFQTTADPAIGEAAKEAGGFFYPGAFGMRPPSFGGDELSDRFDVVLRASGLESFEVEYLNSVELEIDGIPVRVLRLDRILVSKEAAGRPKDLAQIPALKEAMLASAETLDED